ncbi:MAG: carboxypeptidase-like regulatory domain-containing protein [Bacteroidetes bacterium]|nr:carboxypeptidase-like regulatory domain-containing protein [Bacteroidota bacterium]
MNTFGIVQRKLFLIFFLLASLHGYSQNLLSKIVSINAKKEALSKVLQDISQQGNFFFSYNNSIIKSDSIVTLVADHKTVKQVLDALFEGRCQYKETGSHIILQTAASNQIYTISGYVYDGTSGEKLPDVSVYETHQLVSAFTDENGFFKLQLKNKNDQASISISKISYYDTSVVLAAGFDQELTVTVTRNPSELNAVLVTNKAEKTWIAKLFLTSRQRLQSLNISKFFAYTPLQFSLVPGLGTHGYLAGQVVNKFSLNILGGYTGGVNGVEIGGIFNIVKKDVKDFQAAGVFNLVGGKLKGVQLAGLHNSVLDSVRGVQVSGFNNTVKAPFSGFQLSGFNNSTWGPIKGMQAAGAINTNKGAIKGFQLSGLGNISRQKVEGVQIAGLFNYTKKLKGFQLGLINIADSSSGYSIGLINISKNYHVLSVFADETAIINLSYKSGNRNLYNFLTAGYNFINDHKLFSFGFGIGSEINISRSFFVSPELKWLFIYNGDWDHLNKMGKAAVSVNLRINKWISIFAGPSFAAYISNQSIAIPGYQFPIPSEHYNKFSLWNNVTGWVGWQAGINLF